MVATAIYRCCYVVDLFCCSSPHYPPKNIEPSFEEDPLTVKRGSEYPTRESLLHNETAHDKSEPLFNFIITPPPPSVASHEPLEQSLHEHTYDTKKHVSEDHVSLASYMWSIQDLAHRLSMLEEHQNIIWADARIRGNDIWRMEIEEKLEQMAFREESIADMYALVTRMQRDLSRRGKLILVLEAIQRVYSERLKLRQQELCEADDIATDEEDNLDEVDSACVGAITEQRSEKVAADASMIEQRFVTAEGVGGELGNSDKLADDMCMHDIGMVSNTGIGAEVEITVDNANQTSLKISAQIPADGISQEKINDSSEPKDKTLPQFRADDPIHSSDRCIIDTVFSIETDPQKMLRESFEAISFAQSNEEQGQTGTERQEEVLISTQANAEHSFPTNLRLSHSPEEDTSTKANVDVQLQPDNHTTESQTAPMTEIGHPFHEPDQTLPVQKRHPLTSAPPEENFNSDKIDISKTAYQSARHSMTVKMKPILPEETTKGREMDIPPGLENAVIDDTEYQATAREDSLPLDEFVEESDSDQEESTLTGDPYTPSMHEKLVATEVNSLVVGVKAHFNTRQNSEDICRDTRPNPVAVDALDLETSKGKTYHVHCNQTCQVFTILLSIIQEVGVTPEQFCEALLLHLYSPNFSLEEATNHGDESLLQNTKLCMLVDKVTTPKSLVESLNESLEYCHKKIIDTTEKESVILSAKLEEQQHALDRLLVDPKIQGPMHKIIVDAAITDCDDTVAKLELHQKLETFLIGITDLIRFGRHILQHADFEHQSPHDTKDVVVTPSKKKNKKKKKKRNKKKKAIDRDPTDMARDSEIQDDQIFLESDTIEVKVKKMISILEKGRQFLDPVKGQYISDTMMNKAKEATGGVEKVITGLKAMAANPYLHDPADAAIAERIIEDNKNLVMAVKYFILEDDIAKNMTDIDLAGWIAQFAGNGCVNLLGMKSDSATIDTFPIRFITRTRELECRQIRKGTTESQTTYGKQTEEKTSMQKAKAEESLDVFDFAAYLKLLFPGEIWTFQRLPDSIKNYTIRAFRQSGGKTGYETCILKHAPPYIAAPGSDLTASVDRQEREIIGLTHFGTFPKLSLMGEKETSTVLIPRLISQDKDNHILVIHDLGRNFTLLDALEELRIDQAELPSSPIQLVSYFDQIGHDIGDQLATFHLQSTKATLRKSPLKTRRIVKGDGLPPYENMAVGEILRNFNIQDSDELGKRAVEDHEAKFEEIFEVFALGNAGLNSILLDHPARADTRIGLVNFERSGWGRGINGDMAQFFAETFMYLTAPQPTLATKCIIRCLLTGLTDGYRARSRTDNSPFSTRRAKTLDDFGGNKKRLPRRIATALRSLYIVCGQVLLYLAVNVPRVCLCCKLGEAQNCEWVRKTVELGATCLRVAGQDEDDFQAPENWKRVTDHFGLQSWLLRLVFGD